MAFDFSPKEPESPRPWPPPQMWCNLQCTRCRGATAYGKDEPCNKCGRYEDGSHD
jgi:hypothetical protein